DARRVGAASAIGARAAALPAVAGVVSHPRLAPVQQVAVAVSPPAGAATRSCGAEAVLAAVDPAAAAIARVFGEVRFAAVRAGAVAIGVPRAASPAATRAARPRRARRA